MTADDSSRVTLLLNDVSAGRAGAGDELFALVYDELRGIARHLFQRRGAGPTLQPTAVVNEAWMKLASARGSDDGWDGRRHFFAVAAKAMRQVLSNHARDARREKRGGSWRRVTLVGEDPSEAGTGLDLVALDEALVKLGEASPEYLEVFNLRYLAGLDSAEAAEVLGVSQRTVQVRWRAVRAFLSLELTGRPLAGEGPDKGRAPSGERPPDEGPA